MWGGGGGGSWLCCAVGDREVAHLLKAASNLLAVQGRGRGTFGRRLSWAGLGGWEVTLGLA